MRKLSFDEFEPSGAGQTRRTFTYPPKHRSTKRELKLEDSLTRNELRTLQRFAESKKGKFEAGDVVKAKVFLKAYMKKAGKKKKASKKKKQQRSTNRRKKTAVKSGGNVGETMEVAHGNILLKWCLLTDPTSAAPIREKEAAIANLENLFGLRPLGNGGWQFLDVATQRPMGVSDRASKAGSGYKADYCVQPPAGYSWLTGGPVDPDPPLPPFKFNISFKFSGRKSNGAFSVPALLNTTPRSAWYFSNNITPADRGAIDTFVGEMHGAMESSGVTLRNKTISRRSGGVVPDAVKDMVKFFVFDGTGEERAQAPANCVLESTNLNSAGLPCWHFSRGETDRLKKDYVEGLIALNRLEFSLRARRFKAPATPVAFIQKDRREGTNLRATCAPWMYRGRYNYAALYVLDASMAPTEQIHKVRSFKHLELKHLTQTQLDEHLSGTSPLPDGEIYKIGGLERADKGGGATGDWNWPTWALLMHLRIVRER